MKQKRYVYMFMHVFHVYIYMYNLHVGFPTIVALVCNDDLLMCEGKPDVHYRK